MKKTLISLSASALMLSACAGGGTGGFNKISRVDHTSYYTPEQVRALTSGGLPTVLYGPKDVQSRPESYANGVHTPGWTSSSGLDLINPDKDGMPENRLVLVFYAGAAAPGYKACTSADKFSSRGTSSGLMVLAVLCSGDLAYARATLANSSISGPDDPAYSSAVNQLLNELMPTRAPNQGEEEIRMRG